MNSKKLKVGTQCYTGSEERDYIAALPKPAAARKPTTNTRCPHCSRDLLGHLTPSAIAALYASLRTVHAGGRPRTCECGECAKCRMRKYQADRRARIAGKNRT